VRLYPPGTRKNNRFYVFRKYIAGRSYEVSTETTDARLARERAHEVEELIRTEAARVEAARLRGAPATFAEAAAIYADVKGMQEKERRILDRLCGQLGDTPLDDVTPADIALAANALFPHGAPGTKNRGAYTPAAAVLHFAADNGWCSYRRVKRLKEPDSAPRRIARADMHALLASAEGDLRKLLLFLYLQGWRISEALRLKRVHVDFENGTLSVLARKAGKWKQVPMHPQVASALATGKWHGDRAFPWLSVQLVHHHIQKLTRATGLRFTPHMARHAFASELRERGATSRDIVDVGTWTFARSTERYQSATSEHVRALIRRRAISIDVTSSGPDGPSSR